MTSGTFSWASSILSTAGSELDTLVAPTVCRLEHLLQSFPEFLQRLPADIGIGERL